MPDGTTLPPLSILRAAAGEGDALWSLPASPPCENAGLPADPLSALAIRALRALTGALPDSVCRPLGLFLGTTTGSLPADREFDRSRRDAAGRYASPAAFARTLPSTLAAELSVTFGLQGPLITLCAADISAALALRRAALWMRHAALDAVIAGGCDWQKSPSPAAPDIPRAAFFLLSQRPAEVIGHLHLTQLLPRLASDPAAPSDASLPLLARWVRLPNPLESSAGIRLTPAAQ
jgi:hypothetical protein